MLKSLVLFGIPIPMFNVMLGMGLLSALWGMLRQVSKLRVDESAQTKVITAFPFMVIFGGVCAHLLDVVAHGGVGALFSADILQHGIAFLGFVFGSLAYLLVHSKITGIRYLFLLNLYLPLLAIAQAWGRIGCFLGGCCYGRPCSWGIVYPSDSLAYLNYGAVSVFPVQLLESAYLFVVFFILIRFVRFNSRAALYLILMTTGRFCFEFLRGDDRGRFVSIFSPSQLISLLLFISGIWLFFRKQETSTIFRKIPSGKSVKHAISELQ